MKITANGSVTHYSDTGKATTRPLELKWKNLSAKPEPQAKPERKRRKAS